MIHLKNAVITTMTAADATIGNSGLVLLNAAGSAAESTITLLDGTAVKMKVVVAITANVVHSFLMPIAFSNLVVDLTGTASYSLAYLPRP